MSWDKNDNDLPMLKEVGHEKILKQDKDNEDYVSSNNNMLIGFDEHKEIDMIYVSNLGRKCHLFQEIIAMNEAVIMNPFPSIVFSVKLGADSRRVSSQYSHFHIWEVSMDKLLPADVKKCIPVVVKNQIINFNSADTICYRRIANWFSCDNRLPNFSFDRVEQRKHDRYVSSGCEHRSL